jgi:hypothetical protein
LWEKPVRDWVEAQQIQEQTVEDIPTETDDVHKPEFAPKIKISSPQEKTTYNARNVMNIQIIHDSKFGLDQVDFFLNNLYLGSSNSAPFGFSFMPSTIERVDEKSEIKAVAYDKVRNKSETTMEVNFNF